MAGLQLNPNPVILGIQAGVFLTALVVIRQLFVTPYLKIRDLRAGSTSGNRDNADALVEQNARDRGEIEAQLSSVANETKEMMTATRQAASDKKASIIAAAEADATHVLSSMQANIETELAAERAKTNQVVDDLVARMMAKVLH